MKLSIFFVALAVLGLSQAARAERPPAELLRALRVVESKGNPQVVGDRHLRQWAYGDLQVRQPCVDDVNARYGTKYRAVDCLGNPALSAEICAKYINLYATQQVLGRRPTLEDMARIWNGGPTGWKKTSTRKYWTKVKAELARK